MNMRSTPSAMNKLIQNMCMVFREVIGQNNVETGRARMGWPYFWHTHSLCTVKDAISSMMTTIRVVVVADARVAFELGSV